MIVFPSDSKHNTILRCISQTQHLYLSKYMNLMDIHCQILSKLKEYVTLLDHTNIYNMACFIDQSVWMSHILVPIKNDVIRYFTEHQWCHSKIVPIFIKWTPILYPDVHVGFLNQIQFPGFMKVHCVYKFVEFSNTSISEHHCRLIKKERQYRQQTQESEKHQEHQSYVILNVNEVDDNDIKCHVSGDAITKRYDVHLDVWVCDNCSRDESGRLYLT